MPALIAVVAAALTAIGVTGTLVGILANILVTIISLAVSMGLSALMKSKPDKPAISNRRQQLQSTVREPTKSREMIFGRFRKGGVIHFFESVDNESTLLMGIIVAGHEIEGIDEIYNFDELMIDQAGNVQGRFKGKVEFEKFFGTADQVASTLLIENFPGYTPEDRLRGIAHVVFKFKFDRDVFDQFPNPSFVLRGAKVYDPRDTLTKYSPNAALSFAHYLNHTTYGLEAAYVTDINDDMLISAANECDEDVAIKAGKTLEFNGTDNVIDIGAVLDHVALPLTIEARVRPAVVDASGMKVLDKDTGSAGFSLQIELDKVRFITRGLSNVTLDTGAGQMSASTWKHIAAVWDPVAGTKKIYVNGALVATASSVTGSLASSSANLKIGASFNGRIQDVRLWSEARTSTEVAAFDDKTLTGREGELEGYWKLAEKFGKRAEDATEGIDGTITGATWVDDDSILGSEKRYEANGLIFSDQTPRDIIEDMMTAMGGSAVFSGGTWGIRAAAYEPPTVTFTEKDFIEPLKVQAKRSRRDLFNAVRGLYIAPENVWQSADFPPITNATLEAQDGPPGDPKRIWQDIELPFTTSSSMAQRIAFLHLLRNREQVSFSSVVLLKGLRLRAGDFAEVTNTRLGWSGKDFEVTNWAFAQLDSAEDEVPALGVRLELRETAAAIYDFNPATDEVPINPSPDTNLPNWLSNIAIIADFVDRNGFESIYEQEHAGEWPGTVSGFVLNPWTGHLNPQDEAGADFDNVFDEYVMRPVPHAYYESGEVDIDFVDTVRTYIDATFVKGPGITGAVEVVKLYDTRVGSVGGGFAPGFDPVGFDVGTPGVNYDGFEKIVREAKAEARYFKHRVEFDFSSGASGYLSTFKPVIDKMTLYQKGSGIAVPSGGQTIGFPERYHHEPSMSSAHKGMGLRTAIFTDVKTTEFTWVGFDADADDVGGTFDWQSAAV